MAENFTYRITEYIGVLSSSKGISKEINKVSYNGTKPKYDIRLWDRREEAPKLLKGITLTKDEARLLWQALDLQKELFEESEE